MNEIITLDGIKTAVISADLDKDGVSGGVEKIQQKVDAGIQPIVTPTEIGESLKELNLDNLDISTRMSGIDMRARLVNFEVQSVLALDALVALGVLPTKCLAFSRQKKRLSVSVMGKGREEIVSLVAGKRELEAKTSMMGGIGDKFKGFFGMGGSAR
jgi:hypothetical protein